MNEKLSASQEVVEKTDPGNRPHERNEKLLHVICFKISGIERKNIRSIDLSQKVLQCGSVKTSCEVKVHVVIAEPDGEMPLFGRKVENRMIVMRYEMQRLRSILTSLVDSNDGDYFE